MPLPKRTRAFHAMAKPGGPACNLRCDYCFYLEKAAFHPAGGMTDETLEAYVRGYLDATPEGGETAFTWQGGEPTLPGLDFFRRAVALQERHGRGRRISNSFQTNGLLLDESWCSFLAEHDFLVGLSLDGPAELHDRHRRDAAGQPTHERVMRALGRLARSGVRHNILACVNRATAREPLRVYEFFHDAEVKYIQFLPVVERPADAQAVAAGLCLRGPDAPPADIDDIDADAGQVTDWLVLPEDYGRFLVDIFDVWVKLDVGRTFVMNFEGALANYLGAPGTVCHHQPTCGRSVVVEADGEVYPCDHYVYPGRRLGNLREKGLAEMVDEPAQERFGRDKFERLPRQCRSCRMLKGCWGGCPRHRFVRTADGEAGLNYLCPGLYRFFGHVAPYLKVMGQLLAAGRPVADIMKAELIDRRGGR